MKATNKQTVRLNHPAIVAHLRGETVTFQLGRDYVAYLATLHDGTEYIVTEWANGDVGVQRV